MGVREKKILRICTLQYDHLVARSTKDTVFKVVLDKLKLRYEIILVGNAKLDGEGITDISSVFNFPVMFTNMLTRDPWSHSPFEETMSTEPREEKEMSLTVLKGRRSVSTGAPGEYVFDPKGTLGFDDLNLDDIRPKGEALATSEPAMNPLDVMKDIDKITQELAGTVVRPEEPSKKPVRRLERKHYESIRTEVIGYPAMQHVWDKLHVEYEIELVDDMSEVEKQLSDISVMFIYPEKIDFQKIMTQVELSKTSGPHGLFEGAVHSTPENRYSDASTMRDVACTTAMAAGLKEFLKEQADKRLAARTKYLSEHGRWPVNTRVQHFDGGPSTHGKGTIVRHNGVPPNDYLEKNFKEAIDMAGNVGLLSGIVASMGDGARCPYVVQWDYNEDFFKRHPDQRAIHPNGYSDVYEQSSIKPLPMDEQPEDVKAWFHEGIKKLTMLETAAIITKDNDGNAG